MCCLFGRGFESLQLHQFKPNLLFFNWLGFFYFTIRVSFSLGSFIFICCCRNLQAIIYFQILKFSKNFLFWIKVRQSMNKRKKSSAILNNKLDTDSHEKVWSIILSKFSDAYLPTCNATASLVNLPMIKAGIMYMGFILEIPAPKNNGVVGSGNKE